MSDTRGGAGGETIRCPACGRANPLTARTCENCTTALSPLLAANPEVVAREEMARVEREATFAAELGTVQNGAWREVSTDSKPGALPLPPQIQAEAVRREREYARREAEQRAAEKLRAERGRLLAERQRLQAERVKTRVCTVCGAPAPTNLGEGGSGNFSFCLSCGASYGAVPPTGPAAPVAPPVSASATVPSPVGVLRQQARREVRDEKMVQQAPHRDILPITETTPFVSAALSFLFPGMGQLRVGQFGKGAVILLVFYLLLSVLHIGMWGMTALIVRALIALDAYRVAVRKRRGEKVHAWQWAVADI